MKPRFCIALFLGTLATTLPSLASEITVPGISIPKSKSIQATAKFPGKLDASQFTSSVDNAQNSWRSVLRNEGDSVRIGLKVGEWDRPDPQTVDTVWLANNIDWAKVDKRYRDLEFTYTFAESTEGTQCIFKFGASTESVKQIEGDSSFTLTYGGNDCTFRRGSESTSGQLPFKITNGTTVRIRIKSDKEVDIWINDQPILTDQEVDLTENLVGIIAKTDTPSKPHILHLSALKAELVRPEK